MKKSARFKLSLSLTLMVMLLSTSIYAMSLPNKVLNTNSRGEDVVSVQKALNSLGAKLITDGIYGIGTKQAVINFQKTQSTLKDDGIYGPATKTLLEKALNEGETGDDDDNDDQVSVLPNKVIPFMTRGADVIAIQKAMNKLGYKLVADGIYGPGTRQAVLNFQKTQSTLKDDGIYGPATKTLLEKALNEGGIGDDDDNGNDDQVIVLPNKVIPFMTRGADVIAIQKAMNKLGYKLANDGIYGPGTRQAVLNFQKTQPSLSNDGIYGPATKAALDIALKKIAK